MYLCVALLAGACAREASVPVTEEDEFSHRDIPVVEVSGSLVITHPSFRRLGRLGVRGSLLAVAEQSGEPRIHLVDLNSGALIRSTGRVGEGPGDFQSTANFGWRPGDTTGLWILDPTLRRITQLHSSGTIALRVLRLEAPSTPTSFAWLDSVHMVGVSRGDSVRLMLFDSAGRVRSHSPGPPFGPDSVPRRAQLLLAAGARVCSEAGGASFGIVYYAVGRVEIYHSDLSFRTMAKVPYASEPLFEYVDSTRTWLPRTPRTYYMDCAGTGQYLYALFTGRRAQAYPDGGDARGRFVHLFRWDGTLVSVIHLDRDAGAIAVQGDSILLTASSDSDSIFRYRLPAGTP